MTEYVILNGRGEFFCGDWAETRWTAEYSEARVYHSGWVRREASRLRVESLDIHLPIRVVSGYGTAAETEVFTGSSSPEES